MSFARVHKVHGAFRALCGYQRPGEVMRLARSRKGVTCDECLALMGKLKRKGAVVVEQMTLQIREGTAPVCEVHEWPLERWQAEFVALLKSRHNKGGVNVCVECIHRAKAAIAEAQA